MQTMWTVDPATETPDHHVEFRGEFVLAEPRSIEIRLLSSMPALVWLDGIPVLDGPVRFPPGRPEYLALERELGFGRHDVRVRAHHEGVTTRIMEAMPPILGFEISGVEIQWQARALPEFASRMRRINPQLGWIEWRDSQGAAEGWSSPHTGQRVEARKAKIAPPMLTTHRLKATAHGVLAERYGYPKDDPAVRFFLRDFECRQMPATGVWRRYDLGRVMLGRPKFTLDLPAGTVVEFAGCEGMAHERVQPWITLSDGPSCNLDHYVAKGGLEEFIPVAPKGMRFVEVHVLAPNDKVKWVREEFLERHYYDEPQGRFECDDSLLKRIWQAGMRTFRACTEDSMIDNPTRERGQWTGDVVTVGMDLASVGFHDLRPVRRALVQSAQCAREDGLVSGLFPGGGTYLSTYAIQWVSACVHFFRLTGDRALLVELFPSAQKNMSAFEAHITDHGLDGGIAWAFVDWGYVPNEGPSDMALNLHYLKGLQDMVLWCQAIGQPSESYDRLQKRFRTIVSAWFDPRFGKWAEIGLQRLVLALRANLVRDDHLTSAVDFVKQHYLRCFPNDSNAPRLSDPSAAQSRLITPYFSHFALAELWERGAGDFVLDQYRSCWGWALGEGRTTLLEVFDTRWSHCHQWSGCPTWQLSRYVLGLHPRMDLGDSTFDFRPIPTRLRHATGLVPYPGGSVDVTYSRESGYARWAIHAAKPIWLNTPGGHREKVLGNFTYKAQQ